MSVIYKLTHYTKTNGIENNCEEKYFSNFLKLKKFLKEKNISVCKKTRSVTGENYQFIIQKIEVE